MAVEMADNMSAVATRDEDVVFPEEAESIAGRDRATIFRWIDRGWLRRYSKIDPKTRRRRTAVNVKELQEFLARGPKSTARKEDGKEEKG
jgi:hypothetical protein